ncbi:MAG: Fe-S cluster assembly scaffold protein NifU [Nitrospirota bacterium]
MYSELVMEHFSNPRNVGEIPDADGVGVEGNPLCGDVMKISIKVKDDRIDDIKFKTFGCGAAIAVSSIITEMVKGKTLEEALSVSKEKVSEELGGLPPNKMHCSNLGADALRKAIEDYRNRKTQAPTEVTEKVAEMREHICPYCNGKTEETYPLCGVCGADIKSEK